MSKKPHILIINPDEMRWDTMGHMGNRAAYTPTLDRLAAREAVSFDHAYCQNPVCVPSRCSFLTGLYPHTTGHRTMRYLMREGEQSLFSELRAAGYHVWQNGRNDYFAAQKKDVEKIHSDEYYYGEPTPRAEEQKYADVPYEIPKKEGFTQKITETIINDDPDHVYSHYHGIIEDKGKDRDWIDTKAAIERIRRVDELDGKPLCLFLGWLNPHPPYEVEQKYFDLIKRENIVPIVDPAKTTGKSEMVQRLQEFSHLDGLTEEQWIDMRHVYLAQCAKVDHMVEALCDALKEAGIYDDTAIFFFSDHGDWCGDFHLAEKAQNCFEDVLTRVPFLVKPPKGYEVDPGLASTPVELIDFYATAMEWAGAQYSHDHFGKSLTEVIADRSKQVREYAFCEGGRNEYESQCNEWHCEGPDGGGNRGDYYAKKRAQLDDSAHEKGTMITDGSCKFIYRSSGKNEFYNLLNDPYEMHNLYGTEVMESPAMQDTLRKMESEMLKWFQRTADVVPWDYDDRFSEERLWLMISRLVPAEYEDQMRTFIRETQASIVDAFGFAFRIQEALKKTNS